MEHPPFNFRGLYDLLMDYEGTATYADLLAPWLEANGEAREWLEAFAARTASPVPEASAEDLWALFSLGVVGDVLLNGLPAYAIAKEAWNCPPLSVCEFQQFFESLGMTATWPESYSPFHHEIVTLKSGDYSDTQPALIACEWPCLMLGPMLFLRCGAHVSAGRNVLAPGVADAATIYWTHYRRNRSSSDLSKGWGSNSRWRTEFRRDYEFDGVFFLNVDGAHDLSDCASLPEEESGLSRAEGVELLVNRHFVTSTLAHDDLFPYEYSLRTESFTAMYPSSYCRNRRNNPHRLCRKNRRNRQNLLYCRVF